AVKKAERPRIGKGADKTHEAQATEDSRSLALRACLARRPGPFGSQERVMGLEPTTPTLATWRSTTELHPRNRLHLKPKGGDFKRPVRVLLCAAASDACQHRPSPWLSASTFSSAVDLRSAKKDPNAEDKYITKTIILLMICRLAAVLSTK